jgi:hypothetical protein
LPFAFFGRRVGLQNRAFCPCFFSLQKRFNKQNLQKTCCLSELRAPRGRRGQKLSKNRNKNFAIVSPFIMPPRVP